LISYSPPYYPSTQFSPFVCVCVCT
jgi:hypothetical protein